MTPIMDSYPNGVEISEEAKGLLELVVIKALLLDEYEAAVGIIKYLAADGKRAARITYEVGKNDPELLKVMLDVIAWHKGTVDLIYAAISIDVKATPKTNKGNNGA